jgi:hypothetical protein
MPSAHSYVVDLRQVAVHEGGVVGAIRRREIYVEGALRW